MLINNKTPLAYGAHLIDYVIGACGIDNSYILPVNSMHPVLLKDRKTLRNIRLTFDIEGTDIHTATLYLSEMTALLSGQPELYLPDGFYYNCILTSVSEATKNAPWILTVTFEFVGYRHGDAVTHIITDTADVNIMGNFPAEPIFKIITDQTSYTINDITINNIDTNYPIVIDGVQKIITQNGLNKFSDCTLTDFPRLNPGINTITLSSPADVKITYEPIYL